MKHYQNSEPKLYQYCLRCGKKLDRLENKILGYGPVCYKKCKKEKHKRLF